MMSEMRTSLEVIAPNVEEAIARGANELGLPPEAFDVEVIDEGGRGLFGLGNRQVRVRLTIRAAAPQQTRDEQRPLETPGSAPKTEEEDAEVVQIARETVAELLQRMGIRGDVEASWGETDEEGRIRPLLVDIHGDDLNVLIGRRGKTLYALQYITRLILGKELKRPVAVVIDVEGYRARKEKQLRRLARRMAQQALETGRTMTLEPMAPNERRIIHIELRDDPNVKTVSIGEGDRRKVTIVPVR
jgi:spoIIIJ-associated protein